MCDAYVSIHLDKCLLPGGLQKRLNPIVMTIKVVKDLPDKPLSYEQLAEECEPVFCKYSFFDNSEINESVGRPHEKDVHFNDVRVFFLGDYEQSELREYFQENSFHIEVHDRNQKPKKEEDIGAVFGEELQDNAPPTGKSPAKKKKKGDGGLGHVSELFAGLPHLNFFAHHGVAHVSLIDILRGQTNIYTEAAVLPSKTPEFTGKLMREIRREKQKIEAGRSKA